MRGHLVQKTWHPDPAHYAPRKHRRPCTYEAFVPDPLGTPEFELPTGILAAVSDAEQAILRLNTGPNSGLAPLARLLLRTESIASSKVEGMQVGARELARGEAKPHASPTVREALGNIDAMQLAVDEAAQADRIGIEHITAIHARLLRASLRPAIAGRLRTVQNWIGGNEYTPCGANFVPPPPELVEPLLRDLCATLDDETLPPIVQAAVVHAQFETIHPFDDGNGRVGRALIHVILRRRELAPTYVPPISVALAGERDRYIDGLTAFRAGDPAGWIGHFASAAARGAQLASDYLGAVSRLTDHWRGKLGATSAPRADAAAWAILSVLPAHPVITAPRAEGATGRAKSAVHAGIAQLEEAGVLNPLSTSKRNRAWEADGLLDLLDAFESAVPLRTHSARIDQAEGT